MKKTIALFTMIFVFSTCFAEIKEFSVILSGNFNGEYKKLPYVSTFIDKYRESDKNIILINKGNNSESEPLVNDIFTYFYNKNRFDFNFLGRKEYILREYTKQNNDYSAINVPEIEENNRYKIIEKNGCKIAIIGITDLYGSMVKEAFDYEKEVRKLLYKIGDYTDFIIVISELKRNENIKLLKNNIDIAVIFETGDKKIDNSFSQIGDGYIVPGNNLEVINLTYKWAGVKKSPDNGYNTKNVVLDKAQYVEDIYEYGEDKDIVNEIKRKEGQIKKIDSEILGYNSDPISFQAMTIGMNNELLEKTAKKIKIFYNADIVVFPAGMVKGKLEKGFFTKREIGAFFSNDRIIVFDISKENFDKMFKQGQLNRGTEKYLNFPGINLIEEEEKYRVVSTENVFEYYKINTISKEIKNMGIKDFVGGDIK